MPRPRRTTALRPASQEVLVASPTALWRPRPRYLHWQPAAERYELQELPLVLTTQLPPTRLSPLAISGAAQPLLRGALRHPQLGLLLKGRRLASEMRQLDTREDQIDP